MKIILPDRGTIELLHEAVLLFSGGRPGVHSENLIMSAIGRPLTYADYNEDFTLDEICAVLIDAIARNHGFKDGNKRTALMAAFYTYRVNGVHFDATEAMNMDFDELVMWVVQEKPKVKEIRLRLEELRIKHEGHEENWGPVLAAFKGAMNRKKHK